MKIHANARAELVNSLPVIQRLALAYAPAPGRRAMLGLLALDTRMAGIVRNSHEPMLAQLRLSWWREQLCATRETWPKGDPLLALLADWPGDLSVLAALADGWEAMTGSAPLPAAAFVTLADARAEALAALADDAAVHEHAVRLGRNWALGDIAAHLGHPEERRIAMELAQAQDWRRASLPRNLRPLAVLHGIAARNISRGRAANSVTPALLLTAVRLGLLGR